MSEPRFRVYGYRWVVLLAFMMVVIANQALWITFAPITGSAAAYYGVSDLSIGLLSMIFMLAYLVVSIPASWVIDTYGFRVAVGIGAVMTGVFGLMRGLVASDYNLVLAAQLGIAIGQPFILNAVTKVAARWFPVGERATASGFGSLAMYVGILLGMVLTPFITLRSGMSAMLLAYGAAAALFALAFLFLARERPATPPGPPEQEERSRVFDGLRHALKQRDFQFLLLIFFIGLGLFNAVTTWIEDIVRPRGFTITQAGIAGGLMIAGGIVGALMLPALSDRYRRRVPFIIVALVGSLPGVLGVAFATSYGLRPPPDGTSNGLLLLMGQISGIVFILGMDSLKDPVTGSMTPSLIGLTALLAVCILIATRMRESALLTGSGASPPA
jgi:cyanate permease